jgi:hypothetical protein
MSIKNKFATAVATASLLAGLFGSAFVPSALAGRASSTPVVKPAVTQVYAGSGVTASSTWEAADAGKARTFGFYSGSNAGGESVALTSDIDSTADIADNDASIGFGLFSASASGVGTTVMDFALADGTDLKLKATSSNSGVLVAWAYDANGTDAECSDLDNDANNNGTIAADEDDGVFAASDEVSGVDPLFNTGSNGEFFLCLAAASATTAATSTITVTANGVTAATITVTAVGPIASIALAATGGANVAEENAAADDFWQVIAKDAAGTVINGNVGAAKKVAGLSTLDLHFDSSSTLPKNYNGTGSAIAPLISDGDVADQAAAHLAYQYFDLTAGVCKQDTGLAAGGIADGNGDAGKSYELKVIYDATTDITSNGVTILCTGGWDGATVSSVSVDATSGALEYEDADGYNDIYITGVIKDAAGRLMGAGLEIDDDSAVKSASSFFTGAGSSLETAYVTNGAGEIAIGTLSPDVDTAKKYSYSVTVNTNFGSAYTSADPKVAVSPVVTVVTKKYSFVYNASDADASPIVPTVKKNAAKTKATITVDCGIDSSMELIDWDVELANGDLIPYTRKANIDGVVKLSLSKRRTTVRVQAYCADNTDSEVISVSFK